MKKISLVCILSIASICAQTLTPIAVLDLDEKGVSLQETSILSERLRSALVQDGRYQVVGVGAEGVEPGFQRRVVLLRLVRIGQHLRSYIKLL